MEFAPSIDSKDKDDQPPCLPGFQRKYWKGLTSTPALGWQEIRARTPAAIVALVNGGKGMLGQWILAQ
jgi:hypothetical protein